MRKLFIVFAFVIIGHCAIRAQDTDDLARLQGRWKVVTAKTGNAEKDRGIVDDWLFEFRKDSMRPLKKGAPQAEVYTVKLDSMKVPKEINLYLQRGQNPNVPMVGIYTIDNKRLRLSWSKSDGKHPPRSFDLELVDGKNRTRQVSLVLEKIPGQ